MMTIKNAIRMIESMRNWELHGIKIFSDGPIDTAYSPDRIRNDMIEICKMKVEHLAQILSELQVVKQQRLPKKCLHLKKHQDVTSTGQRYCMNCNADL